MALSFRQCFRFRLLAALERQGFVLLVPAYFGMNNPVSRDDSSESSESAHRLGVAIGAVGAVGVGGEGVAGEGVGAGAAAAANVAVFAIAATPLETVRVAQGSEGGMILVRVHDRSEEHTSELQSL